MASLAFRRWCSGLTLCSPQVIPSMDGLWAFLAGLAMLFAVAMVFQGPLLALKQLSDIPGHAALVRLATRRVWRGAARLGAHHLHGTCLDRQPDARLSGGEDGQGEDGPHAPDPVAREVRAGPRAGSPRRLDAAARSGGFGRQLAALDLRGVSGLSGVIGHAAAGRSGCGAAEGEILAGSIHHPRGRWFRLVNCDLGVRLVVYPVPAGRASLRQR